MAKRKAKTPTKAIPSKTTPTKAKTETKRGRQRKQTDKPLSEQPKHQNSQNTEEVTDSEIGDSPTVAAEGSKMLPDATHARETKAGASNRWRLAGVMDEVDEYRRQVRLECKKAGIGVVEARDHAWDSAIAAFPKPAEPVVSPEAPTAEPTPTDSGQVKGLGTIPASWLPLPPNASLQAELSWCQANRLTVVEEVGNTVSVHLDRASTPAPSMSALGWLETSIRSYAKYVDVVARSLSSAVDEESHVRRERASIEDIRTLLAEMLDAKQ